MPTRIVKSLNCHDGEDGAVAKTAVPAATAGRLLSASILLTALTLNHSSNIDGLNLSLADPLVLIALGLLLVQKQLHVPRFAFLFLASLIAVGVCAAAFVTPVILGVGPSRSVVATSVVKLAVSFAFFLVGYNAARLNLAERAIRWFALGAAGAASFAILASLVGFRVLDATMYYGGTRLRGFMVDPNYYAVLAAAALIYFLRERQTPLIMRAALVGILSYSIIISGSRTGLLALIAVAFVAVLERALTRYRSPGLLLLILGACLTAIAFGRSALRMTRSFAIEHSAALPQLSRVAELLSVDGADASLETNRLDFWRDAAGIIESSPIIGVGIGAYSPVNEQIAGRVTLAHNTYLQIAAEWGLPLALLFVVWVGILVVNLGSKARGNLNAGTRILMRDIILIFLVGSISLSLNNARMFWLFLGIGASLTIYEARRGGAERPHVSGASESAGAPK